MAKNKRNFLKTKIAARKRAPLPQRFTKDNAKNMQALSVVGRRSKKSAKEIFKIVDEVLMEDFEPSDLPEGTQDQLTHYLLIRNLSRVAFRENKEHHTFNCEKCKHEHKIEYDHLAAERNSLTASSVLFDRLAPKLGAIRIDVNAKDQLAAGVEIMSGIIVKYVPKNDRRECMDEIHEALIRARDDWGK